MSFFKSVVSGAAVVLLSCVAASAADGSRMKIRLPEAVTVGDGTLAAGEYSVNETTMAGGTALFVFRAEDGDAVLVAVATRSAAPAADQKTEVVISDENGVEHLDKVFIEGESVGYQFAR